MRLALVAIFGVLCLGCSPKARIVLLPDTQTYAEKYPEILQAQADWIVANAGKIDMVLQQGDLTQNNSDKEWQVVKQAFDKLENKVPYILAVGNHDMGSAPGKFADVRNSSLYNSWFSYADKAKKPYFGGAFENGKLDNSYYLLSTGKIKWLVITLEFGPRNEVLDWAGNILSEYPERLAVINTHAYLYSDSTTVGPGDKWRPQAYGVGKDTGAKAVNDGADMWDRLVRKHANLRWVFSGHILNGGVGTLISTNQAGLPVYQMLANYQEGVIGSVKGGNGWLRIIDMDFKKKTARVQTYSPYIKEYRAESAHNFTLQNIIYEASPQK